MSQLLKSIGVRCALLPSGWTENVRFVFTSAGEIDQIEVGSARQAESYWDGLALPGMTNVHSHAFQRGFAGLTEYRSAAHDSFWTWRSQMYDYVLSLDPDKVYHIAKQLYREMLQAGYTWVGEFHYLHRDQAGHKYDNPAEMSDALLRAATETGIGICLLPVLYQRGGFQNEPLSDGQRRFYLSENEYVDLLERLRSTSFSDQHNRRLGMAIHSLRAVDPTIANHVIEQMKQADARLPIHIHVAEQQAEVEACLAAHGKRSIAFLMDCYDVDANWCLIHATQCQSSELHAIDRSHAMVGVCPTTEANLGDGIFVGKEFSTLSRRIAIGSDSHCSIDVREELRWLEYTQRLQHRERAVMGTAQESVGRWLYQACAGAGGDAIGVRTGRLEPGYRADFVILDLDHPSLEDVTGDRWLDRYLFCNHPDSHRSIQSVLVGGRVVSRPVS